MASSTQSSNPPTSEKHQTLPKDHCPPPAHTSEASSVAYDPNPHITAAFSSLNLTASDFPTPDQCLAHLKLLEAFHQLREDVALRDCLFGIKDSFVPRDASEDKQRETLMKIREKRWAVYVARAVQRFERWWTVCVCPEAAKITQSQMATAMRKKLDLGGRTNFEYDNLPPIDVIMVWHAYQLNPRDFLEDCVRYGKLNFWRAGFPWDPVNVCIDNDTFEFKATSRAKYNWQASTGFAWDSLQDSSDATIKCPKCKNAVKVPWTGLTTERMWRNKGDIPIGEVLGHGFTDKQMSVDCESCHINLRHDDLKLMKFWKDVEGTVFQDYPMPGTILSLRGIPEAPKDLERHASFFPNRLLKTGGSLWTNLRSCTTPGPNTYTLDAVRTEIEVALRTNTVVKTANLKSSGELSKHERVAIRRMMSRYWDNFSPFALDLVGAVVRQSSFIEKMHAIDWIHSTAATSTMKRLIRKYRRYMDIICAYPRQVAVPTLDVDLAWHTHQLSPPAYFNYTVSLTSKFIDHDDKIAETRLSTAFEWTSKTYQKMYKELYSECTCWYCEAIRESHTSSLSRVFSSFSSIDQIESQLADLHSANNQKLGPHISSHSSIKPEVLTSYAAREQAMQHKLEVNYRKACERARKKGRELHRRDDPPVTYAWGHPVSVPYYAPYMGDPGVSGG
ncbi:MAG: hypothetical protein Q9164_003223, partial [Protoblastenia rupestris]